MTSFALCQGQTGVIPGVKVCHLYDLMTPKPVYTIVLLPPLREAQMLQMKLIREIRTNNRCPKVLGSTEAPGSYGRLSLLSDALVKPHMEKENTLMLRDLLSPSYCVPNPMAVLVFDDPILTNSNSAGTVNLASEFRIKTCRLLFPCQPSGAKSTAYRKLNETLDVDTTAQHNLALRRSLA